MALDTAPAVTVVIPTHDRLALLEETLRSVAEQHPRTAVVVVDDGSTDGTAEAIAGRTGIELVHNPEGRWGSGRARNAGLGLVTTPYVAFVDSDDLLVPGALGAMSRALDAAPSAPFAFGRALAAARTDGGWAPEGLIAPLPAERAALGPAIFARNMVPSSGALVRTQAARLVGGYDTDLVFSEDHDLWLRLAALGEPVHIPRLVLVHRRHVGNRHMPARARKDDDAIGARAAQLPAFASTEPARAGIQLCEEGLDALRARRPGELAAVARRLLGGRRDPAGVVLAAGRHARRRRAARRAGQALWEHDTGLRDWLAGYR